MGLFSSIRAGIDLGTVNLLICQKGRGIVINQPSVVAIHNRDDSVIAVGSEAFELQGRTPGALSVVHPLQGGAIADYKMTSAMLSHFIDTLRGPFNLIRPEIVITVPAGVTTVEQRAVRDACEQAGARRPTHLIPEPLAAALGADIPVDLPRGSMVVNIGGGRTEAAVISLFGIVASESVRIAGKQLDEAIQSYVRRKYKLSIGIRTAEEVKISIGSAIPDSRPMQQSVRGRDNVSGLPKTIILTSAEIADAISEPLLGIIQTVKNALSRTPPELAADILDRGIVLTGGGALLRDIENLLTQATEVPCYVTEQPLECAALGAEIALDNIDIIERSLPTEEEMLIDLFPQARVDQ
jgi:rod shape-determining protein MreB